MTLSLKRRRSIVSKSRKSEDRNAEFFGGRTLPGSGAVRFSANPNQGTLGGDIVLRHVLIEHKQTEDSTIRVLHEWLRVVTTAAIRSSKHPMLVFGFLNPPHAPYEWAVVSTLLAGRTPSERYMGSAVTAGRASTTFRREELRAYQERAEAAGLIPILLLTDLPPAWGDPLAASLAWSADPAKTRPSGRPFRPPPWGWAIVPPGHARDILATLEIP